MTMSEEQIIQVCNEDPEVERILIRFLEAEAENSDKQYWLGLEWSDVPANPRKLNLLVEKGILTMPFKSRSSKNYKLADREATEKALQRINQQPANTEAKILRTPPPDLFEDIVGYDDVKYWLKRLLQSEGPAGALLVGPPASAKTMLLWDIAEKMGGEFFVGTGASRRGVQRYVSDMKPEILILDELDKLSDYDQSALLSILESGMVAELKVGRTHRVHLDIKIFAAANSEKNISYLLRSRFKPYIFTFKPYTEEEYIDIVKTIGPKKYGQTSKFCERVAKAMWTVGRGDPRAAMNALKTCRDEVELEKLLKTVRKYS